MIKKSHKTNLELWYADKRVAEFLGPTFSLKMDILVHLNAGRGTLAAIARRHSVSRQAVAKLAKKSRKLFGFGL
jgi:hypothetical protein